ncbi:formate/nitrite transporter family protein [uncultured Chitinophaga sp.]|uniref:formate/nitrite transporter family protein n=1 Tax=uncultured Chitinophaga sp. TaxID=339340 RepID=UPI0025E21A51|nr:formate/nitrite transporter family protein [uncultured Chitinophaga sp.]
MDYKKPAEVAGTMIQAGVDKAAMSLGDMVVRGILSGAILGFGTTFALTATVQTGLPVIGAAIFPACFIMVVLLGYELVTGNFAVMSLSLFARQITLKQLGRNWLVVYLSNLAGGLLYAVLFWISLTQSGQDSGGALAKAIVKIAETKTIGYAQYGSSGLITVLVKGVLCNWMVTLGVVMALTSTSTLGKILAAWLPIFIFFAQGFEHAVVNMFVIPAGMMMGAKVSVGDWWLYNQLPVTIGNIAGGVICTALTLYLMHGRKKGTEHKSATIISARRMAK